LQYESDQTNRIELFYNWSIETLRFLPRLTLFANAKDENDIYAIIDRNLLFSTSVAQFSARKCHILLKNDEFNQFNEFNEAIKSNCKYLSLPTVDNEENCQNEFGKYNKYLYKIDQGEYIFKWNETLANWYCEQNGAV